MVNPLSDREREQTSPPAPAADVMSGGQFRHATLFPANTELVALYDADCPLCRASVAWLRARDRAQRISAVPAQSSGMIELFGLSEADMARELHVFSRTGRHARGADAMIWAVSLLPHFHWLRHLYKVPGVLPAARMAYRVIARYRGLLCAGGACRI